jgi:uracil-DNA glycosylase family 4
MKHKLLKNKIEILEKEIFACSKCDELTRLRKEKICNCPVLGFDFNHYVNASIISIGEAPGIYKPQKGEIYIEKFEDFHKNYDNRIQNVALIGKRMMNIYSKAGATWNDIQHFNVVCCSPPDYRKPTINEISNCLNYLKLRIELMQNKKLIVCFGNVAKTVIKKFKYDFPIVYAYHPTYIYKYMSSDLKEKYILDIANKIKEALLK